MFYAIYEKMQKKTFKRPNFLLTKIVNFSGHFLVPSNNLTFLRILLNHIFNKKNDFAFQSVCRQLLRACLEKDARVTKGF